MKGFRVPPLSLAPPPPPPHHTTKTTFQHTARLIIQKWKDEADRIWHDMEDEALGLKKSSGVCTVRAKG